jgi:hypothetical protein
MNQKHKLWQAETLTEIIFISSFESKESKIFLGDYFKLKTVTKDIVFYIQLNQSEQTQLVIPNRYWKSLLEFPHSKRMKTEQQIISNYSLNSFSDDQGRLLVLRKIYPSFWASQHKYFDLEYIHSKFVLTLSYNQIEILMDAIKKLKRKFKQ